MSAVRLRIAVDGPSGAGKSTLARALARRLGLRYLDTGALYRAVGWKALRDEVESEPQIIAALEGLELEIDADPDAFRVLVDDQDVTPQLRRPEVGKRASEVAQIPAVRAWLLELQRREADLGAVLEGRDIGTVVLPDADLKLFITASEQERMSRRSAQLGGGCTQDVVSDIRERDRRDRTRTASPLRAAADAVVIDTGGESPEASLERILEVVRARLKTR